MGKLFFLLKTVVFMAVIVGFLRISVRPGPLGEKVLKAANPGSVSEAVRGFGVKFLSSARGQYEDWSFQIDSFLEEKLNKLQKETAQSKKGYNPSQGNKP